MEYVSVGASSWHIYLYILYCILLRMHGTVIVSQPARQFICISIDLKLSVWIDCRTVLQSYLIQFVLHDFHCRPSDARNSDHDDGGDGQQLRVAKRKAMETFNEIYLLIDK